MPQEGTLTTEKMFRYNPEMKMREENENSSVIFRVRVTTIDCKNTKRCSRRISIPLFTIKIQSAFGVIATFISKLAGYNLAICLDTQI